MVMSIQPALQDMQSKNDLLMSLLSSGDTKIKKSSKQDTSAFDTMSSESGVNALKSNVDINQSILESLLKTTKYQMSRAMVEGGMTVDQVLVGAAPGIKALHDFKALSDGTLTATQSDTVQPQSTQPKTEKKWSKTSENMISGLSALAEIFNQDKFAPTQLQEKMSAQLPGSPERQAQVLELEARGLNTQNLREEMQPGSISRQTKVVDLLTKKQNLKNLKTSSSTKGVYGFDPATGKVTLQASVPKDSDIRTMTSKTGIEKLPQEQQVAAYGLARKVAGVRGAEKLLPSIVNELLSGKSIDKVEDSLRMQAQSPEFNGAIRDAAQSISVGKTESQRNVAFDALDDYVQRGDMPGAQDYLKRMAIDSATADQKNYIMGKERTIDFLDEIKNDLATLEANGIKPGFFSGNIENLMAKAGQINQPGLRKVATKIVASVIQYRRAMTGVQFGQKESEEYQRMFPGINKVGEFNTQALEALKESFTGDISKFYEQSMGKNNYKKIFAEPTKSVGWSEDKEKRYQELKKKQGK